MKLKIGNSSATKLDRSFYERQDVVQIARDLLGKRLCSMIDGVLTSGVIVETEAYCGRGDKACHANNKVTPRTQVMYEAGGHAYVYLCYGIHHLFNVVTNVEGKADAVLVRAIEPVDGLETMNLRRNFAKKLTSGPGTLTKALGISKSLTGLDLTGHLVWIEEDRTVGEEDISEGTRIGVDYAEEDALRPWRFVINGNKYISKKI